MADQRDGSLRDHSFQEGEALGQRRYMLMTASLFMAAGIALSAFGAHALKDRLSEYSLGVFKTGTEYHLLHSIAVLILALIPPVLLSSRHRKFITFLFLGGITIFSGSLYALALTDIKILGAITPIGGVSFIAGWLVLAFSLRAAR